VRAEVLEKSLFNIYPVESPTIDGGDEEKNVHSLLKVGFKATHFLTGFTNDHLTCCIFD
jgi:hypothetical protein